MMIAESPLRPELARVPKRASSRAAHPSPTPRGFVFAVAALPGEAEGFRWPSWLSPVAGSWNPHLTSRSSSKRNR